MKRFSLTLALVFCSFYLLNAQILNIEKNRFRSDTARWIGKVDLLFNFKRQEITTFSSRLKLNVARITSRDYYFVIGDYEWARAEKTNIVDDGFLHFRAGFLRKNFVSPEFYFQTQFNDIRGLQQRNLLGAGGLFRLVRKDKILLLLGISAMYEVEKWDFEGDIANNWLWKNSSYLSLHWTISSTVNLNSIIYYQARFDTFFVPRVSGETNINIRVSNRFRFVSSFNYFYDEKPPVDILKWTYTFKNGIGVVF